MCNLKKSLFLVVFISLPLFSDDVLSENNDVINNSSKSNTPANEEVEDQKKIQLDSPNILEKETETKNSIIETSDSTDSSNVSIPTDEAKNNPEINQSVIAMDKEESILDESSEVKDETKEEIIKNININQDVTEKKSELVSIERSENDLIFYLLITLVIIALLLFISVFMNYLLLKWRSRYKISSLPFLKIS